MTSLEFDFLGEGQRAQPFFFFWRLCTVLVTF